MEDHVTFLCIVWHHFSGWQKFCFESVWSKLPIVCEFKSALIFLIQWSWKLPIVNFSGWKVRKKRIFLITVGMNLFVLKQSKTWKRGAWKSQLTKICVFFNQLGVEKFSYTSAAWGSYCVLSLCLRTCKFSRIMQMSYFSRASKVRLWKTIEIIWANIENYEMLSIYFQLTASLVLIKNREKIVPLKYVFQKTSTFKFESCL